MRRIYLAVVPALLVLTSCSTQDDASRAAAAPSPPVASPSESSADLPDPVPTCSLIVRTAEVGLTERQAIAATDLAADALAAGSTARELAASMSRLPGAPLRGTAAARALLGYDGPALSCLYGRVVLRDERLGPTGLTPRAERVRNEILRSFGYVPMGGFASGDVSTGHVDNSAHYEGRAIDIFFRPHTDAAEARRGWVLSQWLVVRAERLQILSVIYRDHIWTVWASFAGWRNYEHPDGPTTDPVLRHLDHVHTAVIGALDRDDR